MEIYEMQLFNSTRLKTNICFLLIRKLEKYRHQLIAATIKKPFGNTLL